MVREQHVTYHHGVLEGTAREAGRRQGERLALDPRACAFLTSPHPELGPLSPQQARQASAFFDRHCPGLNEEIAGFAEALAVPPEQIVFHALSWDSRGPAVSGHCSHAVVRTRDGHVRVARNYDFNPAMSDLGLVTARIEGRAAHIGFSEVLFGRDDGLNEHGLCVTMSAGAPLAPVEPGAAASGPWCGPSWTGAPAWTTPWR
jgi:predicted choloylglycine hydrolase